MLFDTTRWQELRTVAVKQGQMSHTLLTKVSKVCDISPVGAAVQPCRCRSCLEVFMLMLNGDKRESIGT